jgi:predicted ATPase
MRLLTPRKRTSARTSATGRRHERVLQDILTGPDTAHRRELEILLEERAR